MIILCCLFLHSVSTDEYVVPVVVASKVDSTSENQRDLGGEEDQGRTSGEEDGGMDNYDRQVCSRFPEKENVFFFIITVIIFGLVSLVIICLFCWFVKPDGQSRAFYVVMDLVETERA